MQDVISTIPSEAWPLIEALFNIVMAVTGVWLAWTAFIWWRRSASNLTTASGAIPNKKAAPDFLSVDEKARKEAIKRGESFDKELSRREREDEKAQKKAALKNETPIGRIGRLISFGMAMFSIATMISGTVFQVSIMGRYWEQYSASERLLAVIQNHPIGVTVTVLVIVYNIFNFITNYKSERS
ncbi:MAG: hypothetical protein ABJG15_13745 [Hyphomonadaceae bacterium]